MIFTRLAKTRGTVSSLALAAMLATGGVFALGTMEAPAAAKEKAAKPAKGGSYSKEFVAAYQPLKADEDGGTVDAATLAARIPALIQLARSDDEKFAAGQVTYSIGNKAQDLAMQRQGLDLMLASNKLAPNQVGQIYFAAGQLASNAKDYAAARAHFEKAGANGYSADDVQVMVAESYFSEQQTAAGLDYLDKAIAAKVAAGQPVPEMWMKRGLSVAYNEGLAPQAIKYGAMYAQYFPSATSWNDAIAIQRNLVDYPEQDLLDLMRLAQRASVLKTARDYVDYISAADARRLPGEVSRVVEAGIASGALKADDVFVKDVRTVSSGRLAADRADLPKLDKDARLGSATALTAAAAGDAFLSHGQAAKAEEFYTLALAKPGVDTARVLTRLGIAQFDQGKYAEAQASFAKVEGARQAIARLWGVYAQQKVAPAAAPATAQ